MLALKDADDKKVLSFEAYKARAGWIFILPFLFGVIFLFGIPLIKSLIYSFGTVRLDTGAVDFAGIQNYYDALFVDTEYREAVVLSVRDMLINLPLITLYSFFIANLLNQKFVGRSIFRVIFFLPLVISSAAMMSFDAGDALQSAMGIGTSGFKESDSLGSGAGLLDFLYDSGMSQRVIDTIYSIVEKIYNIAELSGVQTIIFLAALQSIPRSVYEAAAIEGATSWETFWKVTFPMIMPMLVACIIYTIIDSFNSVNNRTLEIMQDKAYGATQNFGLAAAMAWIYSIVILLIIGVIFVLLSRVNRINSCA